MMYLSTVLADAPQHFWRCADPGGHLLHDIGSATPAALYNMAGAGLPYSGVSSEGGSSWFGTGSKGGGLIRNNFSLATSPWSLECWCFVVDLGANSPSILTLNNGAASVEIIVTTGKIYEGGFVGFGGSTHAGAGASTTEVWHHLVLTYDHANLRFYLDGALSQAVAIVADPSDPYDVFLAQSSAGAQSAMALAEVAFYTTQLSLAQVAAHYGAADTKGNRPVFRGGGSTPSYPTSTGGPFSGLEAQILASVRKTY